MLAVGGTGSEALKGMEGRTDSFLPLGPCWRAYPCVFSQLLLLHREREICISWGREIQAQY